MLAYTIKRLRRTPLPALGVLLFSLVLVAVLRGLYASNEAQQQSYEETWRTIPVKVSVTNLAGTRSDDLEAPVWIANTFTGGSGVGDGLARYMKDVLIKSSRAIDNADALGATRLVGLTGIQAEKGLRPENGGKITWLEGFDESVLLGDETVCLAPETMTEDWDEETPGQQLLLYFHHIGLDEWGERMEKELELSLTVAGRYAGTDSDALYCPYKVVDMVYQKLQQTRMVDSISATLSDNDLLEELIAARSEWFAEPVPGGTRTEWGYLGYEYYLYALDINDELLRNATATLENGILINRICTLLIFGLSTGAGFLIGFLMIRQRKQEIALMRTVGTPERKIYGGFATEQMLCVILGVLIGGAVFGWQPVDQLAVFVGIYFVGLTAALLVFLRGNLLTGIKQTE